VVVVQSNKDKDSIKTADRRTTPKIPESQKTTREAQWTDQNERGHVGDLNTSQRTTPQVLIHQTRAVGADVDPTADQRTTPKIPESQKTTREAQWTDQNARDQTAHHMEDLRKRQKTTLKT